MKYFGIQFLYLLLLGTFVTTYSQTNSLQKTNMPPTASNFAYPQSIFIDSYSGHIWVTDFDNHRVLRFDVSTLTGIDDPESPSILANYFLGQNYPNPFNPGTKISWQTPVGSWQTLKVYDVLGNEIATLVDEYKPAGSYDVEFNTSSIKHHSSSGVYFYQLRAGDYVETNKMLLLK